MGASEKRSSQLGIALGGVSHFPIPSPAAGSNATRSRGSPPRSRCTAGQPLRQNMPWTVCVPRMPTPRGWAMRSTFLDRCYPAPPSQPAFLVPGSFCASSGGSQSLGLSTGRWKKGWLRAGQETRAEPASASLALHRPGTGTKNCKPQGSCPARTCLSGCFEKEPYSR